ncbi:hypothetical protein LTR95_009069 [Oleoguttula sp. CCFEE 5521]
MASHDLEHFAKLCRTCQGIFQGHWAATDEAAGTKAKWFELYEPPEWVHLPHEGSTSVSSRSPYPHLSVDDLRRSASDGCQLCVLILDAVSDEVSRVDDYGHMDVSDTKGTVAVRPYDPDAYVSGQSRSPSRDTLFFDIAYVFHSRDDHSDTDRVQRRFELIPVSGKNLAFMAVPEKDQTPSRALLGSISAWAVDCLEKHATCKPPKAAHGSSQVSSKFPTRLIDVSLSSGAESVRLCDGSELTDTDDYLTLSHCWGRTLPVRLLKENECSLRKSIVCKSLPQTFQDAIYFTQALSQRYIWIDALSIVQDSAQDWGREAQSMSHIYAQSLLNIAATSAVDGSGGLFRVKDMDLIAPCVIKATWSGHRAGSYMCIDQSAWQRRIESAPLNKRAWVFQERLLSARTVHFARDMVWWECRQQRACQAYPGYDRMLAHRRPLATCRLLVNLDSNNMSGARLGWNDMLHNYARMEITKQSDRLIAIAGVASFFCKALSLSDEDYVAGLWKRTLAEDLLWRVHHGGRHTSREQCTGQFPSWTWAKVNDYITLHTSKADQRILTHIKAVNVSSSGGAFGATATGHITLSGELVEVRLSNLLMTSAADDFRFKRLSIGAPHNSRIFDDFEEGLDDLVTYRNAGSQALVASWLVVATEPALGSNTHSWTTGLVLRPLPTVGADCYERIGYLSVKHHEGGQWKLSRGDGRSEMSTVHLY